MHNIFKVQWLPMMAGALSMGCVATPAAQNFPTKPIQFLVSFPAGSGTDLAARVVGDKLRERTGQSVVIVNRPGAGATLGALYVAKANPDGYTIAIAASTELAVAPNTRLNLGYDPRKELSLRTPPRGNSAVHRGGRGLLRAFCRRSLDARQKTAWQSELCFVRRGHSGASGHCVAD